MNVITTVPPNAMPEYIDPIAAEAGENRPIRR